MERVEHGVERAVEEVAEHVPASVRGPVRWTVRRLIVVGAIALVALVGLGVASLAYYAWNHTEWAAHEIAWRVNRTLAQRSDVVLDVGSMRGNPLRSVEVLEPRVRFRDRGQAPFLEARRMRLRYSTWELMTARRGALVIELERPVIRLDRGADGALRLPTWKEERSVAGRAARGFDFTLRIRKGDVVLPDSGASIGELDLEADIATGNPARVVVKSMRWQRGLHGMRLGRLAGEATLGDSVQVRIRELESPDLALSGRAAWSAEGTERVLEADVRRVRWSWLARLFRNATLDVSGEGRFAIHARERRGWSGRLSGSGDWSGVPFTSEGRFTWSGDRLALEDLAGRSTAGELRDARVLWSKREWEIEGGVVDADPSHWEFLGLQGWPSGRLAGRLRYRVDTRGAPEGRLEARLRGSTLGGWNADSGEVVVDFPAAAADSFVVVVHRRGGQFRLGGRVDSEGWTGAYQVASYPLDEWPDGRATGITGILERGGGTVAGRASSFLCTGELQGRHTAWLGARATRWEIKGLEGRILPTPDLEADLRLGSTQYLGVSFDSAATPVWLGDSELRVPALAAWAGDTLVTLEAGASWDRDGWRLTAARAEARSPRFHWIAEPPLALRGDDRGVVFERLEVVDGESRLGVTGRWAGPGGSFDWRAEGRRLRLDRLGAPPEQGLEGIADLDLSVLGPAAGPRWRLGASVAGPAARGHRADSLQLQLEGGPGSLEIREAQLELGGGRLRAEMEVSGTRNPWPDTLTFEGIRGWLASAGRWEGRVAGERLPIDQLMRWQGQETWGGRVDGVLDLGGRPERPEARLTLTARPVSWGSVDLDEVTARAEYRDERFRLGELRMTRNAVVSTVTGEMELRLSLGGTPELMDAPMEWRLDLPHGDLGLLAAAVPQIGAAAGRFEVVGEVRGTPRRPLLSGSGRVRDGRIRLAGREEVLEGLRADFTLAGSRVTLDSLIGVQRTREGERGVVRARGQFWLRDEGDTRYRFELSMRDFTAIESGTYAARFDGDFVISDGSRVNGHLLPHVTSDNVQLRRAVILYDFARQTEAQVVEASTQPLYWTYQIRVQATDNLRWQPPDGDIEFSADLTLLQTPEKLSIFGDMEALRGTYYFLSNRFQVRRATLTFDNVQGVDPLVDAEADTRLAPSYVAGGDPGVAGRQTHTITVRIRGRSSQPAVEFESDPGDLDEAQILRELTVGRFVQGETVALTDPLDSYLTRAISRQLSAELSRAFRGYLTEWEVARESGGVLGEGGFVVGVGSQLNERIALRYRQLLPGARRAVATGTNATLVERDIEAEYRINRFFYITSQLTQRRPGTGSASTASGAPDFNVNLKARWEY